MNRLTAATSASVPEVAASDPTGGLAPEPALAAALAPVGRAMRERARADARRALADAGEQAKRILADAHEQANAIVSAAREGGATDAAFVLTGLRARARRYGRQTVLRAERECYDQLRQQARTEVMRLRDEPDYPQLRAGLVGAAHRLLGPDADIREAPDGGLIVTSPGRRVELTLTAFADRAVDDLASQLGQP